jgi:hypothetical protein
MHLPTKKSVIYSFMLKSFSKPKKNSQNKTNRKELPEKDILVKSGIKMWSHTMAALSSTL